MNEKKSGLANVVLKPGANAAAVAEVLKDKSVLEPPTNFAHPKEPTEHAILLSQGVEVPVIIDGKRLVFEVRPFKFKQFESVVAATAPIFEKLKKDVADTRKAALDLMKDNAKLMRFLAENRQHIQAFILAFVPDITAEQIDELHMDGIADLVVTSIQVNLDFFMERVTPSLTENLKSLLKDVIPKLGSIQSAP